MESRGRTSDSVLSGDLNVQCAERLVSKGKDASLTHSGMVSPPPRGSVMLRPTTPLLTRKKQLQQSHRGQCRRVALENNWVPKQIKGAPRKWLAVM